MESYELSAYFYNRYVTLTGCELCFYFVTGDEHYFDKPDSALYEKFLGAPVELHVDGTKEWKRLMERYNVFHIRKEYGSGENAAIYKQWCTTLGEERVLSIQTPKAVIDVILGAIAITTGVKTLETYVQDMKERGQTEQRLVEVSNALKMYAKLFHDGKIKAVQAKPDVALQTKGV